MKIGGREALPYVIQVLVGNVCRTGYRKYSVAEAMFAGPICGASMNSIRSLSPAIVSGHVEHLWIYLSAPIVGAALAVLVWKVIKSA